MLSEQVVLFRLLFACIMGGLIGWERGLHDRPAGFRTHILVAIGSALVMLVSIGMMNISGVAKSDPGRIAAQVVSGIGFLGAGTIIREGMLVKGLTTAASLWAVAGVGLAAGAGLYFSAFAATGLIFVTLLFLNKIEFGGRVRGSRRWIEFHAKDRPGLIGDLGEIFGGHKVNILNISTEFEKDIVRVIFTVILPVGLEFPELNEELTRVKGINFVDWK